MEEVALVVDRVRPIGVATQTAALARAVVDRQLRDDGHAVAFHPEAGESAAIRECMELAIERVADDQVRREREPMGRGIGDVVVETRADPDQRQVPGISGRRRHELDQLSAALEFAAEVVGMCRPDSYRGPPKDAYRDHHGCDPSRQLPDHLVPLVTCGLGSAGKDDGSKGGRLVSAKPLVMW